MSARQTHDKDVHGIVFVYFAYSRATRVTRAVCFLVTHETDVRMVMRVLLFFARCHIIINGYLLLVKVKLVTQPINLFSVVTGLFLVSNNVLFRGGCHISLRSADRIPL